MGFEEIKMKENSNDHKTECIHASRGPYSQDSNLSIKKKTFAPKEELADQDRQLKKEQTNQDCGNSMVVGVVLHVTVVLYALLLLA